MNKILPFVLFIIGSVFFQATVQAQQKHPQDLSVNIIQSFYYLKRDSILSGIINKVKPEMKEELLPVITSELVKLDTADKILGWAWVGSKEYTKDLYLQSVLIKTYNRPYRMDLLYYRINKTWYLQHMVMEKNLFPTIQNYQKPVQPCIHCYGK